MLVLKEPFLSMWTNKDPFEEIEKIQGKVARALETRETLRFEVENEGFYLKHHRGTTVGEVIKNLIQLRLPVLGADREWNAIHRLNELGVDTMEGVAFGQQGCNPIRRNSFIITKDLAPVMELSEYCKNWQKEPPSFEVKEMLIRRVATMTRKMHQGGINHRDCYLCHFLLGLPFDEKEESLKLYIIDLHRSQMRDKVPQRWRDKDLIGLYFSSMDIGLSQKDIFRFLKTYFQASLKEIFKKEKALFAVARKKAERIKERTIRKGL